MNELDELTRRAQSRVGQSLRGKYLLERLLGVGGMAAVYEATHRNGMRVAAKVLHKEIASDKGAKMRFLREGYVANRIGHPGVVKVLDDDEDTDGSAFIAMELLDGITLEREWSNAGQRLPLMRVVAILDELLDVLDAAHASGVIHRDVKPDNVFVTNAGPLKVLDFGIARIVDQSRVTRSGEMMGTPEFVSPEQAGGRVREVDARADLFSLGAVAFTLLTGEYTQIAKTAIERMIYAATKPARRLVDVAPAVHADIAHVIDVALSFAIEDRWASARAMRAALRSAATNAGITLGAMPSPRDQVDVPPSVPISLPTPSSTTTVAHGSVRKPDE